MLLAPVTTTSIEKAVGAASVAFGAVMGAGSTWMYVANVATWITQGATPVATAGSLSTYVPANVIVYIDGGHGADLAQIQDVGAGKASLTQCYRF